jgi:hypothetical protein
VRLTFLSPEAAIIGLAVAVPVIALMLAESRARIARAVLKLPAPIARGWPYVAAIAAFAIFVSIGAAQPVLERERTRTVRNDAEALFVFDTTRSMAASSSAGSDTRFERAVRLGKEMRAQLPELRVGVASVTDRVLAHLFPSGNYRSFELTLDKAIGIERPASVQRGNGLGSSLEAFTDLPKQGFFAAGARYRVLVIFTDAETRPFNRAFLADSFRDSRIETIVIRIGSDRDRVYVDGAPDPLYVPEEGAAESAEIFAEATGGGTFDEDELGQAIDAARRGAGEGGPQAESKEIEPTPLASYAFAAAFLPLAFLLWRRNFR